MNINEFFKQLWHDYSEITPQAARIHQLFEQVDGPVSNDHVAFRTVNQGEYQIARLEQRLFQLGYERATRYEFPVKKLEAWSYQHKNDSTQPLVFLSQLLLEQLSDESQSHLEQLFAEATPLAEGPEAFIAGRPWPMPDWPTYQALADESEYAAWLSVWGFRANHFTISVNALRQLNSLERVIALLEEHGFALNESGGVIKGSPDVLLEQASTLADKRALTFRDGDRHEVPSCYYEFARRYNMPDGSLYRGFVAASADKIFESTNRN